MIKKKNVLDKQIHSTRKYKVFELDVNGKNIDEVVGTHIKVSNVITMNIGPQKASAKLAILGYTGLFQSMASTPTDKTTDIVQNLPRVMSKNKALQHDDEEIKLAAENYFKENPGKPKFPIPDWEETYDNGVVAKNIVVEEKGKKVWKRKKENVPVYHTRVHNYQLIDDEAVERAKDKEKYFKNEDGEWVTETTAESQFYVEGNLYGGIKLTDTGDPVVLITFDSKSGFRRVKLYANGNVVIFGKPTEFLELQKSDLGVSGTGSYKGYISEQPTTATIKGIELNVDNGYLVFPINSLDRKQSRNRAKRKAPQGKRTNL